MPTPEEQLHIIKSGVAELVPEDELLTKLRTGRELVAKLGVDPTAPDLHLGHAVPLRKLRQFQDLGHRVVLIIGDFTALIGDPSGRSATRPPLTPEQVAENARTYTEQAFKILDPARTELRPNSEWLSRLSMADILRLTSHFTVAQMLDRDDFRNRYTAQQPISLHEFLYPVMVAYDSVVVQADVELGGNDQLFNFLAGRGLMRELGEEPQVCLTMPLLEGTDGVQKMSKSYGNYIGLTDAPADVFGKVMSIPDALMPKYYRLATALPVDEVDRVEAELSSGAADPNAAKRRLAREIVALYHGEAAAADAEAAFDRVFKAHEAPEDMPRFSIAHAYAKYHVEEAPLHPEPPAALTYDPDGECYLPRLLNVLGLVGTSSEGRRKINEGGVRVDGRTVPAGGYTVRWRDLAGKTLQVGRRKWARITE